MTPQPEEKLKSAEEWTKELVRAIYNENAPNWVQLVNQIQQNAYRAGMRRAAEVAKHASNATEGMK